MTCIVGLVHDGEALKAAERQRWCARAVQGAEAGGGVA